MSVQTSMSNDPSVAYEGMVSQTALTDIITKIVQTSTGISAGRFVKQGTADDQCAIVAAAGDVTGFPALGFTIYDPSVTGSWPLPSTTGVFQQGQAVSILRKGRIWIFAEEAVTPADDVYVRHTTGSYTVIGRVGTSSDTSTAALLPGARFMTTAAQNALVLVEINLPQ